MLRRRTIYTSSLCWAAKPDFAGRGVQKAQKTSINCNEYLFSVKLGACTDVKSAPGYLARETRPSLCTTARHTKSYCCAALLLSASIYMKSKLRRSCVKVINVFVASQLLGAPQVLNHDKFPASTSSEIVLLPQFTYGSHPFQGTECILAVYIDTVRVDAVRSARTKGMRWR